MIFRFADLQPGKHLLVDGCLLLACSHDSQIDVLYGQRHARSEIVPAAVRRPRGLEYFGIYWVEIGSARMRE